LIIAIGTVALAGATFWLVLGARRAARDAAKQLEIAARQLEIAAKAAQLSAAQEFMREYRSFSMRLSRLAVRKIPPHKTGRCLHNLPPHQYEAATRVSHFLDQLGALVVEGLLAPKPAFSFGSVKPRFAEQRILNLFSKLLTLEYQALLLCSERSTRQSRNPCTKLKLAARTA
jgi:hypothetical protein